jgi:hypothetical protein
MPSDTLLAAQKMPKYFVIIAKEAPPSMMADGPHSVRGTEKKRKCCLGGKNIKISTERSEERI